MTDRIPDASNTICDYCEKLIKEESFEEKIDGVFWRLCGACYYGCGWKRPVSEVVGNSQKN
jgi:hypothetical protein